MNEWQQLYEINNRDRDHQIDDEDRQVPLKKSYPWLDKLYKEWEGKNEI